MVEGNGSDKAPAETMTLQNVRFRVQDVRAIVPGAGAVTVHLMDGRAIPIPAVDFLLLARRVDQPKLSVVKGGVVQ